MQELLLAKILSIFYCFLQFITTWGQGKVSEGGISIIIIISIRGRCWQNAQTLSTIAPGAA